MIAAATAAGDAKAGTATVRLGEEFVKAGGGRGKDATKPAYPALAVSSVGSPAPAHHTRVWGDHQVRRANSGTKCSVPDSLLVPVAPALAPSRQSLYYRGRRLADEERLTEAGVLQV